jgi:hypothetical protein
MIYSVTLLLGLNYADEKSVKRSVMYLNNFSNFNTALHNTVYRNGYLLFTRFLLLFYYHLANRL